MSFEEAEKLKIDYSLGKLDAEATRSLHEFFREDCHVWQGGVELSLAEFSDTDLLPTKIFLCGGGSGLPGIREALLSNDWSSGLPFAKTPQVSFLQPRDIVRITDATGVLSNPQDITPMGLVNLALHLAGEEKSLAGMLRRAMESVQK